jgi:hypothetical protein
MSNGRTKLAAVEKDGQWTVRLDWPNGLTRYLGSFRSRSEALTWIALNRWMTAAKIEERDVLQHRGTLAVN